MANINLIIHLICLYARKVFKEFVGKKLYKTYQCGVHVHCTSAIMLTSVLIILRNQAMPRPNKVTGCLKRKDFIFSLKKLTKHKHKVRFLKKDLKHPLNFTYNLQFASITLIQRLFSDFHVKKLQLKFS